MRIFLLTFTFVLLLVGAYVVTLGGEGSFGWADGLEVPREKLLPTSKFYFLKDWKRNFLDLISLGVRRKVDRRWDVLNERLYELVYVMKEGGGGVEEVWEDFSDRYINDWEILERDIGRLRSGDTGKLPDLQNDLLEKGFLHYEVLSRLEVEGFDVTGARDKLVGGLVFGFSVLGSRVDTFDFINDDFSTPTLGVVGSGGVGIDLEPVLLRVKFFDDIFKSSDVFYDKWEFVSMEKDLIAQAEGYFVAGRVSFSSVMDFVDKFLEEPSQKLEFVDVLRESFYDDELRNYLNSMRQEMMEKYEVLALVEGSEVFARINETQDFLDSIDEDLLQSSDTLNNLFLRVQFNLDRAVEFYEDAIYLRSLGQVSLSESALRSLVYSIGFSFEKAENQVGYLERVFDDIGERINLDEFLEGSYVRDLFTDFEEKLTEAVVGIKSRDLGALDLFGWAKSLGKAVEIIGR